MRRGFGDIKKIVPTDLPADNTRHMAANAAGPMATDSSASMRAQLSAEQAYVTTVYDRLDAVRAAAGSELRTIRLASNRGNTHQGRSERDARSAMLEDRLAQLDGVEEGLCFGRLDRVEGDRIYVGRIGLSAPDYERLLVDWRAPAARPFYSATPGAPEGVTLRRHLQTRGRQVVAIEDDVLDLDALDADERRQLAGEGALLAAMTSGRTGRMANIVATIQAEQDAVIRADLPGVLVVEGGPGTGKTAVALHRAAYLLYEHRERLAADGVLVVGPNAVFLRYIERVLPSLGETGVVLSTVDGLVRGVDVVAREPDAVAALKGDVRMVDVLAAAVRSWQRVPRGDVSVLVGAARVTLPKSDVMAARTRGRRGHRPHNRGRATFVREFLDALAVAAARELGRMRDPETAGAEVATIREDLAERPDVLALIDEFWPVLTPAGVLSTLLSDRAALRRDGRALAPDERALLVRHDGAAWTAADLPLIDELHELLGEVASSDPARRMREAEAAADEALAAEVMADLDLVMPVDPSIVAARYRGGQRRQSTAEAASRDRTWTYGHVVVDEAQELSPMAWRMLARRCPRRSMTVVGDLAQASTAGAPSSWADVLDRYAPGRWRRAQLTVSYRTPAEIMAVAAAVMRIANPDAVVPTAIRSGGDTPWALQVSADELVSAVGAVAAAEAAAYDGDGLVGVVAPESLVEDVAAAVGAMRPVRAGGAVPLDGPVVVLTPDEVKGLEFDTVLVVEPATIVEAHARGRHDLYVAVTRATQRLGVVHSHPLPAGLADLTPRPAD